MRKIKLESIIIVLCTAMISLVFGSYFLHFENPEINIYDLSYEENTQNLDYSIPVSTSEITSDGKININTAEKDILVTLDDIGETMAERIIEYRTNHPFETIEDFMKVSGIGQKTFDKNKDKIAVK